VAVLSAGPVTITITITITITVTVTVTITESTITTGGSTKLPSLVAHRRNFHARDHRGRKPWRFMRQRRIPKACRSRMLLARRPPRTPRRESIPMKLWYLFAGSIARFCAIMLVGIGLMVLAAGIFGREILPLLSGIGMVALGIVGIAKAGHYGRLSVTTPGRSIPFRSYSDTRLSVGARWVSLLVICVFMSMVALLIMASAAFGMAVEPLKAGLLSLVAVAVGAATMWYWWVVLSYLRRGKPAMVIDEHGIDHAWFGLIRWQDIEGIALRQIETPLLTRGMLQVGVTQIEPRLETCRWMGADFAARPPKGSPDVAYLQIPLYHLSGDATQIHQVALNLRSTVEPPMGAFWYPGKPSDADIARGPSAPTRREPLPDVLHRLARERWMFRVGALLVFVVMIEAFVMRLLHGALG
jgi:hypothetical protein